MIKPLSKKS